VLIVKSKDVGQQIGFLFLGLNSGLKFGYLDSVVCGQRECRGSSDKGSDVPLLSLTFRSMWKAGKKVLEEFENLIDVGLEEYESAVKSDKVVFIQFEVEMIEVKDAVVHMVNHFLLKMKKGRIVEGDPYMAHEGGCRIVTHRMKMKLQFIRLRKD
jgi:hypothetical protein